MPTCEIEIWVVIDDCGDYAAGVTSEGAAEAYEERIQVCSEAQGLRRIKVTLEVALPEIAELSGYVSALGGVTLIQTRE